MAEHLCRALPLRLTKYLSRYTPMPTEISTALRQHRMALAAVGIFSLVINFLYLTPSIYMLQVYDRVVTARSEMTLVFLSLLTVGLFLVMGALEFVRSMVLIRVANGLDKELSRRVFTATFEHNLRVGNGNPAQALADLNGLRQFLSGSGIFALVDAPWFPIYLGVIFMLNPYLGWFAVAGTVLMVVLTFVVERISKPPLEQANRSAIAAGQYANSNLRNAEVIESMGMLQPLMRRWYAYQARMLNQQTIASQRVAILGTCTKTLRLVIQSGSLGLGAYLVINRQATPGIMIAASILTGRAMAPVDQLIGSWKGFVGARQSHGRLKALMQAYPPRREGMSLPPLQGRLTLENVHAAPPGTKNIVLQGINLTIATGEIVGVIGPSAAGKSSLARLMVGVWRPLGGSVRLDNADVHSWNKAELGPMVGYVPQDVELFGGTVAENISRFGAIDSQMVVQAARLAGVHDLILRLPNGYDTPIGEGGSVLSGGQRQRIAIARALYGLPVFVVMDEPNSNLDDLGESSLIATVKALKQIGRTVVIITHRISVLQAVDKLLVLRDGTVAAFGPRDEVLQGLNTARQTTRPTQDLGATSLAA